MRGRRAVLAPVLLAAMCLEAAPVAARKKSAHVGASSGRRTQQQQHSAAGASDVGRGYGCAGVDDPQEVFRIGMEIGRGGEFPESRVCFERYVELMPADGRGFQILAEVNARMSDFRASLSAAEKAVSLAPDSAEALFLQASALLGLHEYREAREIFTHVITDVDPGHVNSMVNLGSLLGNLNDHAEAVSVYRRVLEIQPDLWQAKHNLGTSYHSLKRFSEARALLEEVYRDVPGCFECVMSLANTLREAKDLSASKDMYEDALSMNAASREAVLHLYTAMQELVDWDDLDIMFERVLNATRQPRLPVPAITRLECLL